jgi:sugar lactone lactonase YvrE
MPKDPSIRAFKCPSCGAPQEPERGTLTMKCGYCGGSIIIPESLRTPAPGASSTSMGDVYSYGLQGIDLNKVVGNANRLPEVISLAQDDKIDEAARIYSQITGMEHADSVQAVKALAAGKAVSLTPGRSGATWQQFETSYSTPGFETHGSTSLEPVSGRSCGAIVGITALIGLIVVGLIAGAIFLFANNSDSIGAVLPPAFATKDLEFGSEGIGQGKFKDPRAIGVDGDGNMTVADYDDGRVQTFDAEGDFKSGFSVKPDVGKVYVTGMGVAHDGTTFVAHSGRIHVYDAQGTLMTEIGDDAHRYESVVVGGDGRLYATSDNEDIVRFNPDYSVDLEIPDTFTTVTGDLDIGTNLAADGLGNMYIVGAFHYLVMKYSPQGQYVDQFGGQNEGASDQPGKFTSPRALAVDGYGRIFVADFFDIKVFDAGGNYITKIELNDGVPFGIVVDDEDRVYVVTSQSHVIRYAVQRPTDN